MKFNVLFLLSFIPLSLVRAEPALLVSYPDHPVAPLFMPVIKQSYQELGIEIMFVKAPLVRRLVMLNKGQVDADLGAIGTAFSHAE